MWFKNLRIYRLAPSWNYDAHTLNDLLTKQAFRPGNATDMISLGWASPRPDVDLVYANDGQYLIALRVEKKLLPASVVDQFARAKAHEIEKQQGYKPGRKQMKEIKEQIIDQMLPKAFSTHKDTFVWIDTRNLWLAVDAASEGKAEEVLGMLAKVLDPFPLRPIYTKHSAAAAMTNWLIEDTPPDGFSIDQDTELQATNETRATVRYLRQSMDLNAAKEHVAQGKQCTRLAMTWADRVSFILTDDLVLKRVTPLDVLTENTLQSANEAERFDSDFMLMTGELSRLLDDLVVALGGERQIQDGGTK